jgi:hypothetical protein
LRKQVKKLRDGTILRYLDDLRVFGFDPVTISLQEIQARLAMFRGSTLNFDNLVPFEVNE